ncbi:MAG: A24 family peptidase [Candidatus Diapherotrites archaeon]
MELLIFRVFVLIIGSAAAAYTDVKTGLINDYITYPMIALGILFSLIEFNLNAFIIAAAVFAFGYLLYFLGQIGGGDVKLFTGIALLMPFFGETNFLFPFLGEAGMPFVIGVLFVATILAFLFNSIYYIIKYAKKGIDFNYNKNGFIMGGILAVFLVVYFYLILQLGVSMNFVIFMGILMVIGIIRLALERGIRKEFYLETVPLEKLEEDEIAAIEFIYSGIVAKAGLGIKRTIGKGEIEKLMELKVKEVAVFRNLPKFAPFVFAGVLVVILYPNILEFILF